MKCPTGDKLSQYVDDRLAHDDVAMHVHNCTQCQQVVATFEREQQFIKETLQTPTLPDDFTTIVLNQLEPYERQVKRKKLAPWKRVLFAAAGVVLALGVSATLNPSFAEWIGGLFSTEQVDDGLKMAMEAGLTERVNLEVVDNGMTLKVEDVLADSSRVAVSYQILNRDGEPQDADLRWGESGNEIIVIDQNGTELSQMGVGWQQGTDYGLIEIPLNDKESLEKMIVKFDLAELGGVKGSWKLEVPIDLTKKRNLTTTVSLQGAKTSQQGVVVKMKEVQYAPSSTKLFYETGFTKEEQASLTKDIQKLESQFGIKYDRFRNPFESYKTDIQYHIENGDGKVIASNNAFTEGKGHPIDVGLLDGSNNDTGQMGQLAVTRSFIPQKEDDKLTFVLDGIFKTVPSDFSIKIKPEELKKNPLTFDYEGNYMTIKKVEKQRENVYSRSSTPVEPKMVWGIEMEGGIEVPASRLETWILTDDKGNSYPTVNNWSILDEKDKNGRYKTTIHLAVPDLDEEPEELTLHLVSVTRYEEIEDVWAVPLYK
ncbi:DUF4179 domain-containing protein [Sporosarcina sp. NPDC096371]|uniref:DUF4179 domain-containing protein n=1 Tax=Sporosarcina sp. NPDC096371 TaxID=3364530 RepID=UPI00380A94C0